MNLIRVNGYYLKSNGRRGILSIKGELIRDEIVNVIKEHYKKHKYSPTIREICDITNIKSTSTVHKHLKVLKDRGIVEWNPSLPRTLRILNKLRNKKEL